MPSGTAGSRRWERPKPADGSAYTGARAISRGLIRVGGVQLNEGQTRAAYIDQQLAKAGWHLNSTNLQEEYQVGSMGEPQHGFSDYLLRGKDGRPLAVVEAKRSSRDALAGKRQAQEYAEAISEKDDVLPFVFLTNGNETWFWDLSDNPRLVPGFFPQVDLERRRVQRDEAKPLADIEISGAIVERPYQHEAIRRAHEAFEARRRKILWVMATGTGKTRAAVALVDTMLKGQWAQKVLFLADRKSLARQALDAFQEHLPTEPSAIIRTATFDATKRIYVATLQTMQDFHEYFSPAAFDLIFSDECHRSIYDRWEPVISYFDARLVGLTATPADYIARNTFAFFSCDIGVPTFAYELDQGVDEGYLVPYEAYHARTTIQVGGIHGAGLSDEARDEINEQGIDPDDLDFAGSDLEKKVTNEETTKLLVEEFLTQAIASPDGQLPGKSIIFAISHAHAKRLWQMFNALYPQWPGLVEIIDSHMEQPQELLKQFKRDDMPRIAISVDMLDTGVDVPTVVNLGLMKPVFSRIKFWQMLGRGTRLVDDYAEKPWCPAGAKDRFRVLDFWENFERFQLNPDGLEPSLTTPVASRYFRQLLRAARVVEVSSPKRAVDCISKARALVARLPMESSGVREHRTLMETVSKDSWWQTLTHVKHQLLSLEVAPLMRYVPGLDLAATTFSSAGLDALIALAGGDADAAGLAARHVQESVARLPTDHPSVAADQPLIKKVKEDAWAVQADEDDILEALTLSHLMHLREREAAHVIHLNLADAFAEKRWIAVGPEAKAFDLAEYREQVEQRIRNLAESHPAMLKLATGQVLSEGDLSAIEAVLNEPGLFITEEALKKAYEAPHGSLLVLLRHALGLEELQPRAEAVKAAFETFVTDKGYLDQEQILYVRLFAARLAQAGCIHQSDLLEQPFTLLSAPGVAPVPEEDLEEMFTLAHTYELA